uniref:Uncharacterized protein n=1 Tax=Davidia involucrata TaxID=16924 RepID=A0A5B7AJS8_DAVIN
MALEDSFPHLFQITSDKDATVADFVSYSGCGVVWTPCFRRDFQDWEMGEVESLMQLLYRYKTIVYREDSKSWRVGSRDKFSVSSFHMEVAKRRVRDFLWKAIW